MSPCSSVPPHSRRDAKEVLYTNLAVASVRGQRYIVGWNETAVRVHGPIGERSIDATCTFWRTYPDIKVKAVVPFSVGGKTFLLIHDGSKEVVIRRMYMNGKVDDQPVHRETYGQGYERMIALNVGDMAFVMGHNADV